jgi:hypothetical protein
LVATVIIGFVSMLGEMIFIGPRCAVILPLITIRQEFGDRPEAIGLSLAAIAGSEPTAPQVILPSLVIRVSTARSRVSA